ERPNGKLFLLPRRASRRISPLLRTRNSRYTVALTPMRLSRSSRRQAICSTQVSSVEMEQIPPTQWRLVSEARFSLQEILRPRTFHRVPAFFRMYPEGRVIFSLPSFVPWREDPFPLSTRQSSAGAALKDRKSVV